MAKRSSKPRKSKESYQHIKPTPPAGVDALVESGQTGFLNFDVLGQQAIGKIMGTVNMKNQRNEDVIRWQFLPDDEADVMVLPDHYDLVTKLGKMLETNQFPFRVWIQYLGKQEANTPAGFVQRYAVAPFKATE